MTKLMKIKSLKNYGIPSYILNIWEKHYSPYLLPVQEDAVINYGILDDKESKNLLVIAPTSSGKSFIGEMAAITQVTHLHKIIDLVPFRSLAEEKYRHFKNLYSSCGVDIVISTRDRREDDHHLIQGDYKMAVLAYEKFHYFLWKYPEFLSEVSLVIIDEMQMINHPKWGPLLEDVIEQLLKKDLINLRIIALSALLENQEALLKWFPAQALISHQYPLELRQGIVRDGIFKYISSNKKKNTYRREIFFQPETVCDNCFEDYLLETVRYLVNQEEPTLIFFATDAETRKWAKWLASQLNSPSASTALKELRGMEETSSRDELLELLEKGMAYYNQDLSWEERNLIEIYLQEGEIKIICATTILTTGTNLPFKNVIIPLDKMHNDDEDYRHCCQNCLTFTDIENMGGRAGRLNRKNRRKEQNSIQNKEEFGRVIFLAYSLLSETIYQNLYFNFYQHNNHNHKMLTKRLVKKEKDLLTFLLRLVVKYRSRPEKIKKYLKEEGLIALRNQSKSEEKNCLFSYWQFIFDKENLEEEIDNCLNTLKENKLIREDKKGILSPTAHGILITAKRIKVETYLFLKTWMKSSKKGEISDLEILFLLSLSQDGKELPLPFPQFYRNDDKKDRPHSEQEEIYGNKLLNLVFEQGDEDKKLYQDKLLPKNGKEEEEVAVLSLEDRLAFKKTLLLYNWIMGSKELKAIEQEYSLYRGAILRLGEGFSWLANSLAAIAESRGWKKKREEDLKKIRILSKRLIEGIKEEGLNLARLYIPGLSRYYIGKLVKEGCSDEKGLQGLSEEELAKALPKRLVQRIKSRIKEEKENREAKKQKVKANDSKVETEHRKLTTVTTAKELKTETGELKPETILEIDPHRPDRIIFLGKEVKLTPLAFSLISLLAQNRGKVLTYDYLLGTIWKENEDATYVQVTFHLSKIRRFILKAIGNNKRNIEKVKDIFKIISRRGIILNLEEENLKII
jgi:helicase